jgi:pimeloyl-ACP methyl ester carboxylesterase
MGRDTTVLTCPFCDSPDVEEVSQWGGQIITRQVRCRSCNTYFEAVRDDFAAGRRRPDVTAIALDGRRLEVLDIVGNPALPALVLLHEGLGSVGLWRAFPEALAEATGARVVAFSRFGHGASDPPPSPRTPRFMHTEALAVLPAFLAAADVTEPILVGHSDGASIALIHAAAHPVRALVAMSPHVFVEEMCLVEIRAARHAYESEGLRERIARHHRDPDAAFYGWNSVWLHPDFPRWNIEDVLADVTCPVLLIQGLHDQYGTMAQLDAIERQVAGPVTRVHPHSRHAPHLEAPEETLAATAAFVRSVAATSTA